MNNKISLYGYYSEKMLEYCDVDHKVISYPKARWVLSNYRIPKWLQMVVINEMIDRKMLKRLNQRGLEIKR